MEQQNILTSDQLKKIHQLENMALMLDKAIQSGEISDDDVEKAQTILSKIDKILVDDNNSLGSRIYILYEVQALIFWIKDDKDEARDFLQIAINTKGDRNLFTESADDLSELLNITDNNTQVVDHKDMTKQERRKKLIGLEGWLAWYVVGLFIGTGITIFNFFNGGVGLSSSDIDSLNQYQSGIGDTFRTITTFENVALVIYAALLVSAIVFILRRKKLAKAIAIAGMVFGVVYTIADYAIASSMFDSANLTQYVQSTLSSGAQYAGRNVAVALVWIPYFLVSKRVKATLTK